MVSRPTGKNNRKHPIVSSLVFRFQDYTDFSFHNFTRIILVAGRATGRHHSAKGMLTILSFRLDLQGQGA